jgi:CMP-N-acetylneuraminic acid synthetase
LDTAENYFPAFGMLLQPTSPLRTAEDIDAVIRLAQEQNADAVVSVTAENRHPLQMKVIDKNGKLAPFMKTELADSRRQDLPPVVGLNGAIYLVRRTVLQESKTWCPSGALAYVMPAERSLDVDTPWDLRLADLILGRTF